MSDFENLPQSLGEGAASNPIVAEDLKFDGETLQDIAALKIVYQTALVAQKFVTSKTLVKQWNDADDLYRDIVTVENWPNTKKPRSAIPMPVVMEAIESLLPQVHTAFFSDTQPFLLDPKGKTTTEAARAMAHLVCWAIEEAGFEEEVRKILKSCFQYGTGIGKIGWETIKKTVKKYHKVGASVGTSSDVHDISRPTFEYVSLRNVLVNPHTNNQDIRTSKEVIFQKFVDATELDALRKSGDYKNVPTREQLKNALATDEEFTKNTLLGSQYLTWRDNQAELPTNEGSADPLKRPLELLEYWDGTRTITVLQRCIVIRNEEHDFDGHPFRSCSFIDVLDSFYGFGVAKLLQGEQGLQQGVLNKWVDALSLKLNPTWHRKKGSGTNSQNISVAPGKVVNDDGELTPLPMESVTDEALNAIQASEARAARRVGANSGPEMPTQAMRTAEGVQAFTGGVQVKLQYFIKNFANLVFKPVIRDFIQLTKDNLEPDQIEAILSERDSKALATIDVMDVYNGQYSVDVLSSVELAARRAMAQMIVPLTQMLGQPAVQQSFQMQRKKFNFVNFFNQIFEITGWPGDELVEDMTDEDKQWVMQNNAAMIAAQSKQQQQTQQQQNTIDQISAKGDTQAGVAVVKKILDAHSVEPAEVAGANG
jgi:hypothetical protein